MISFSSSVPASTLQAGPPQLQATAAQDNGIYLPQNNVLYNLPSFSRYSAAWLRKVWRREYCRDFLWYPSTQCPIVQVWPCSQINFILFFWEGDTWWLGARDKLLLLIAIWKVAMYKERESLCIKALTEETTSLYCSRQHSQ